MARKRRFNLVDIPQHIIQYGNNNSECFFTEDDYAFYLDCLKESALSTESQVHAYALMPNHIQLLVTPRTPDGVSAMMQALGRLYVRQINKMYKRSGTLWQGRYKACLVEPERYVMTCSRYIELSPVRVNKVMNPADYPWTSYRHNALGESSFVISPHREYIMQGTTRTEQQSAYRELFTKQFDSNLAREISNTLNNEMVLGTEDFKDRIATMVSRRVRPGKPGRPPIHSSEKRY